MAEVDITPPVGVEIAGWLYKKYVRTIADPLYAHILVVEDNHIRICMISLDLLATPWKLVAAIRRRAGEAGCLPANVLVCATHNHAGPAVVNLGQTARDEAYCAELGERVKQGVAAAIANLRPAQIAAGSALEHRVSFIRRAMMKNGSVLCHPPFGNQIRCLEGVIDPEVGIVAIADMQGRPMGFVLNFACHPTHHGHDGVVSAGWPGALYRGLRRAFGPACVTLLLNGALGDVFHRDALNPDFVDTPGRIGEVLTDHVLKGFDSMRFSTTSALGMGSQTLHLPLRDPDGRWGVGQPFRQRFARDEVYDQMLERLRGRYRRQPFAHAEVQLVRLDGDTVFVGLPAEAFAAIGLEIKMQSRIAKTYVVGLANGMVGYIPTQEAFARGGYEATLGLHSKCEPASGNMLVQAAVELVHGCGSRTVV